MTQQRHALASAKSLSLALAENAYRADEVRLLTDDLEGCDHIVSTRNGLFGLCPEGPRQIAWGRFFGLTLDGEDVLAFEACDRPSAHSRRGRIIRLRRRGGRITSADVLVKGLDNGCHQIDVIHDTLIVVDTYAQSILEIALPSAEITCHRPLGTPSREDWAGGYAHINALIAVDGLRLILLHNGADRTGRPSELAILDARWRLLERRPLPGLGCHDLALTEQGRLLSCGSFAGELFGDDGFRIKVSDMMTRGLSVGEEDIAVGGSPFGVRSRRDEFEGEVRILDRGFQLRRIVPIPAPPVAIRRLDGRDLTLSRRVAALGVKLARASRQAGVIAAEASVAAPQPAGAPEGPDPAPPPRPRAP
ncbi:MAG: hypothetical protein KJ676_05310 [Alphaproteobacteria bacterium]|nr:hypothetical protein [Alphaproteobacteria bacterium]MBU1525164.1 hypothetical protein [Alphaproteobacteria bacterium]MBU2117482.1 hypothetical protein [Alphaproteobacteria bacterium]MBU2352160.1 hypothetical protein [Alphaproteobacteria bacterium]MBU2381170.1 hypothetical protein [Alphaproteobacteria bacterium]